MTPTDLQKKLKEKTKDLESKSGGIQSVTRALTIMEVLAENSGELSLNGICEETGLNVSTCHHLLKTLAQKNYVIPSRRGTYALGSQILVLAGAVNRELDLPRRAGPMLDNLNQDTGEAVHLAVMQNDELVTLLKREARHALRVDTGTTGKSKASHRQGYPCLAAGGGCSQNSLSAGDERVYRQDQYGPGSAS